MSTNADLPSFQDNFTSLNSGNPPEKKISLEGLVDRQAILDADVQLAEKITKTFAEAMRTYNLISHFHDDDTVLQFVVNDGQPAINLDDLILLANKKYVDRREQYPPAETTDTEFPSVVHAAIDAGIAKIAYVGAFDTTYSVEPEAREIAGFLRRAALRQMSANDASDCIPPRLDALSSHDIQSVMTIGERHHLLDDQALKNLHNYNVYNFSDSIEHDGISHDEYEAVFDFIGSDSYMTASSKEDYIHYKKDHAPRVHLVREISKQIENLEHSESKIHLHRELLVRTMTFSDDTPDNYEPEKPVLESYLGYIRTLMKMHKDVKHQDMANTHLRELLGAMPKNTFLQEHTADLLLDLNKGDLSDRADDNRRFVKTECDENSDVYQKAERMEHVGIFKRLADYLTVNGKLAWHEPELFFNNVGQKIEKTFERAPV